MIRRSTAIARVHAGARAAWTSQTRSVAADAAAWAERPAGTEAQTSVCERDGTELRHRLAP